MWSSYRQALGSGGGPHLRGGPGEDAGLPVRAAGADVPQAVDTRRAVMFTSLDAVELDERRFTRVYVKFNI